MSVFCGFLSLIKKIAFLNKLNHVIRRSLDVLDTFSIPLNVKGINWSLIYDGGDEGINTYLQWEIQFARERKGSS